MFHKFSFISLYIIQFIQFAELFQFNTISSDILLKNNLIKGVYAYNINPVKIDISKVSFKNPQTVISYLSSLNEYTIISVGDKYIDLEDKMNKSGMKTYFANLDYLTDLECKELTCNYIRYKYKNVESAEDLWFFHKGFFIGSRNEIYNFIKRRNPSLYISGFDYVEKLNDSFNKSSSNYIYDYMI